MDRFEVGYVYGIKDAEFEELRSDWVSYPGRCDNADISKDFVDGWKAGRSREAQKFDDHRSAGASASSDLRSDAAGRLSG